MITFDIVGTPAPQGSKSAFLNRHTGKPGMRDMGGKGLVAWRDAVASKAAELADEHGCFDGPLRLVVLFRFPMPASRPKPLRLVGCCWKSTMPDSSKLLRSLEDALKDGGLIADDARIAEHVMRKVEVFNAWTGATVGLSVLRSLPPLSLELPIELELFEVPA